LNIAKVVSYALNALQQKKITQEVKKDSTRFYKEFMCLTPPTPSFFRLMLFRMSHTGIKKILDEKYKDYRYFKEKSWLSLVIIMMLR